MQPVKTNKASQINSITYNNVNSNNVTNNIQNITNNNILYINNFDTAPTLNDVPYPILKTSIEQTNGWAGILTKAIYIDNPAFNNIYIENKSKNVIILKNNGTLIQTTDSSSVMHDVYVNCFNLSDDFLKKHSFRLHKTDLNRFLKFSKSLAGGKDKDVYDKVISDISNTLISGRQTIKENYMKIHGTEMKV